jgi:hypothetical protein
VRTFLHEINIWICKLSKADDSAMRVCFILSVRNLDRTSDRIWSFCLSRWKFTQMFMILIFYQGITYGLGKAFPIISILKLLISLLPPPDSDLHLNYKRSVSPAYPLQILGCHNSHNCVSVLSLSFSLSPFLSIYHHFISYCLFFCRNQTNEITR